MRDKATKSLCPGCLALKYGKRSLNVGSRAEKSAQAEELSRHVYMNISLTLAPAYPCSSHVSSTVPTRWIFAHTHVVAVEPPEPRTADEGLAYSVVTCGMVLACICVRARAYS
ncbi:hypothetical protein C8R47DRAFT_1205320 [Mycena vitilis]|nr:hypothetical protein C8R47DRAFT_1205320 [Mycena vitilis]